MGIPHRGSTSKSTYFVTANVFEKKSRFQVEKITRLFIEVMMEYRAERRYLLHEFVVMPNHLHVILSPTGVTLERAMQLIKGGFSFQLNRNLRATRDIWQPSFQDRRVRDAEEYEVFKKYIWENPVKRFLAPTPQEYPYSSANPAFQKHMDAVPQRLKPVDKAVLPQA